MRWFFRFLLQCLYRFRGYNEEVLNTPGPVLLVPNHVSWLDWLFLVACLEGDWKFVVSSKSAQTSWLHRRIMLNKRTFPIDTTSPYAVKRMAEFLQGKGRLVLFAEGRLSRTGTLMKLFDGTGFLLHKTNAKVITCYLRGPYRLPFSPNPDVKKWFPTVSAHFSEVLTPPRLENMSTSQARSKMTTWLCDRMIEQQFHAEMAFGPRTILEGIVDTARKFPTRIILEDVTRTPLSYRRLLVGADLLAQQWQNLLSPDATRVGLLLPNVNATPVALLSLLALGKVPAVINYTTGLATMLACTQLAGLKQIITSRAFVERFKLDVAPFQKAGVAMLYLEDARQNISSWQKLTALLRLTLNPRSVLRAAPAPDDTAVIFFTSGSEGMPKGVELTHKNLLANMRQMLSFIDLTDNDRFFNAMPLFHSFGLSVGTLLPLIRGVYVFLYPSPLHYRVVPAAFYDLDCTVMFGTNTFLNGYARKAHAYDFRALRYLFAAAEKVQEATATTWMRRFGVRILEGYGATECSPCVTANTPMMSKHSSVGRFLPEIAHRLEKVEGVKKAAASGCAALISCAATSTPTPTPNSKPSTAGTTPATSPNWTKKATSSSSAASNASPKSAAKWSASPPSRKPSPAPSPTTDCAARLPSSPGPTSSAAKPSSPPPTSPALPSTKSAPSSKPKACPPSPSRAKSKPCAKSPSSAPAKPTTASWRK